MKSNLITFINNWLTHFYYSFKGNKESEIAFNGDEVDLVIVDRNI